MNLLKFWKHKKEGHVLKQSCVSKLPAYRQMEYVQTIEEPTHYYDSSADLITGIIVGEILAEDNNQQPQQADSSPSFEGFGGGDFGGGGSSDSFSNDSSSVDSSSSSYDSGSSNYDSGSSSYDSGSSSSDW